MALKINGYRLDTWRLEIIRKKKKIWNEIIELITKVLKRVFNQSLFKSVKNQEIISIKKNKWIKNTMRNRDKQNNRKKIWLKKPKRI